MNRRSLTKFLAILPFYGGTGLAEAANPNPEKNIKLPSGEWLSVGKNWKVKCIGDSKSKINSTIKGYFDREFNIFILFDEYDGIKLQQEIMKMESMKGFSRGIVYNNGTNKFGILGIYYQ